MSHAPVNATELSCAEYTEELGEYTGWGGGSESRWQIFQRGLKLLPYGQQVRFLIGLCETFVKGSATLSQFSDVITFVILIIVLLIKPTGLFGEKIKEKV